MEANEGTRKKLGPEERPRWHPERVSQRAEKRTSGQIRPYNKSKSQSQGRYRETENRTREQRAREGERERGRRSLKPACLVANHGRLCCKGRSRPYGTVYGTVTEGRPRRVWQSRGAGGPGVGRGWDVNYGHAAPLIDSLQLTARPGQAQRRNHSERNPRTARRSPSNALPIHSGVLSCPLIRLLVSPQTVHPVHPVHPVYPLECVSFTSPQPRLQSSPRLPRRTHTPSSCTLAYSSSIRGGTQSGMQV